MVFDKYFKDPKATADEMKQYYEKTFFPITAPIHGMIPDMFEQELDAIDSDFSRYQVDYPALHRVIDSVYRVFQNLSHSSRAMIRDEKLWLKVLEDLFSQRSSIATSEELEGRVKRLLVGLSVVKLQKRDQKSVNDMLAIIDLVTAAYLGKDERTLIRLSAQERRLSMRATTELKLITENLREAEKGLRRVLSEDHLLRYRELATGFAERTSADAT